MITINKHGKMHYRMECEDCGCIFEYDKVDIGEYIENDKKVLKINCPECGMTMKIEEGEFKCWKT